MRLIPIKKIMFYSSVIAIFAITGCSKDEDKTSTPDLTTLDATGMTYSTAVVGGNVTADGGTEITARGVAWGTSPNPTLSDSITVFENNTLGTFKQTLSGLAMNTTYYVRAYASNSQGTEYGNEVSFKTLLLNSYLVHESMAYELDNGILEFYGQYNENPATFNFDLTLFSSSVSFNDGVLTGIGNVIYFEMYSSSAIDLIPGIYSFDIDETSNANTFDVGVTAFNFNMETGSGEKLYEIRGGTVKIEKSGESYEIKIDCNLENGIKVTGYYKNVLTFFDYAGFEKSSKPVRFF